MTRKLLTEIIKSKRELEGVPVIGNVDFGHTIRMISLPIGGTLRMKAENNSDIQIEVLKH